MNDTALGLALYNWQKNLWTLENLHVDFCRLESAISARKQRRLPYLTPMRRHIVNARLQARVKHLLVGRH